MSGFVSRSSAVLAHIQWTYLVVSDQWWKRKDRKLSYKPQNLNEECITSIFSLDQFCRFPAFLVLVIAITAIALGGKKDWATIKSTDVCFRKALRLLKENCTCVLPYPALTPAVFPSMLTPWQLPEQLLLRLRGLHEEQKPLRVSLLPSAACLLPCLQPMPSPGQGEEAEASVALCTLIHVCRYVFS